MATSKGKTVAAKTTVPQPRMSPQEKQWMAQDDLHTMRRAQEVMNDPKRMKAMQAEATKQAQTMQKIANTKVKK